MSYSPLAHLTLAPSTRIGASIAAESAHFAPQDVAHNSCSKQQGQSLLRTSTAERADTAKRAMRGAQAALLVAAFAAALQPPKKTPVRRANLSASAPDAVAIDEGTSGRRRFLRQVVVAAIDENKKQYVAKRARKDDRSKRYFEVERTINEKLRGTPGLAPYRGVVEGPTPKSSSSTPPPQNTCSSTG